MSDIANRSIGLEIQPLKREKKDFKLKIIS